MSGKLKIPEEIFDDFVRVTKRGDSAFFRMKLEPEEIDRTDDLDDVTVMGHVLHVHKKGGLFTASVFELTEFDRISDLSGGVNYVAMQVTSGSILLKAWQVRRHKDSLGRLQYHEDPLYAMGAEVKDTSLLDSMTECIGLCLQSGKRLKTNNPNSIEIVNIKSQHNEGLSFCRN